MEHIQKVDDLLALCIEELRKRGVEHDKSKLDPPEKDYFDKYTPMLKNTTYGSDEYKKYLREMKKGVTHHYHHNRHHPEHWEEGISGMNLIDLLEMVCDWYAASQRHADGDIYKSIEQNQARFLYTDSMKSIFKYTVQFIKRQEAKRAEAENDNE